MRQVLVVDDDPDIRELLRAILDYEGFSVETARDGLTALDHLLHTDESWVVLLDIAMPRMTGIEVCERLHAAGGTAAQHLVVLMTAGTFPNGDPPPPVRELLSKPFYLETVVRIVSDLTQADDYLGVDSGLGSASPTHAQMSALERNVA